jgi:pyruvate,water dikinase
VLSDDELRRLVELGNQIEAHFGCPQDIEWGVEDGIIHLLQSRPITCL